MSRIDALAGFEAHARRHGPTPEGYPYLNAALAAADDPWTAEEWSAATEGAEDEAHAYALAEAAARGWYQMHAG